MIRDRCSRENVNPRDAADLHRFAASVPRPVLFNIGAEASCTPGAGRNCRAGGTRRQLASAVGSSADDHGGRWPPGAALLLGPALKTRSVSTRVVTTLLFNFIVLLFVRRDASTAR